ncbi:hypothetical protein HJC23_004027 [Cyclotella cryptica]|uniref:UDP-N-acetylglucosamine transferase subunit ALG13 n=1 Tax=Cyclotella cryptica TaxID=29204 RepID=A0ABD3R045_9STRA|eukprot:CCRYP_002026-RA/>CCRYP_002026-RA protein AED:0.17 eAED:0.17 QI:0/-1/0/1/-1/1/1/0/312
MKRIFATVGTTSFDQFVESICSLPFLTATLQARKDVTGRPPSAPSASSLPSTSVQPHPWLLCEVHLSSKSSHSIPSSSESSPLSSSTDTNDRTALEDGVEIIIQYGRGKCPIYFLRSAIRSAGNGIDGSVDDEGSITLSLPTHDQAATNYLRIIWYRFKPSLSSDMEQADLILCHAGAGTLLEALALPKAKPSSTTTARNSGSLQKNSSHNHRVINAVINTKLMDNHQSELAEELERRNHILVTRDVEEWTTFSGAEELWEKVNSFDPKPFHGRCGMFQNQGAYDVGTSNFQKIVDRVMGICSATGDKDKES